MSDPSLPLARPWQEIARELAEENDRTKTLGLMKELSEAYDAQELGLPPSSKTGNTA